MKKQIILLALCVASICSSQEKEGFTIAKGNWLLGGSINYSTQKNKDISGNTEITGTRFIVSPKVGYAINDNLVIGTSIDYLYADGQIAPAPASL